jgi:hypothetical protein
MSESQRASVFKWLPLAVAIVGPFIGQAIIYGAFTGSTRADIEHLKQGLVALHEEIMPMDKRMLVFIPRTEFMVRMEGLDRQMEDIRGLVRDTNAQTRDTNAKMNTMLAR